MIEGSYGDMRIPTGNEDMMFGERWMEDEMPGNGPGLRAMGPLPPYSGPPIPHRVLHDDRFIEPHRFQPNKPMLFSPNEPLPQQEPTQGQVDAPRYTKWRERRDVITSLDRQTAQSSSRTDSLKSSLQHHLDKKSKNQPPDQLSTSSSSSNVKQSPKSGLAIAGAARGDQNAGLKKIHATAAAKRSEKSQPETRDISDGEIVDDESSDDDETPRSLCRDNSAIIKSSYVSGKGMLHENVIKRKRANGDPETMDYENISDEELDDFMSERKDETKGASGKASSGMELLNALGLDWAHLIEMSKQSKKEAGSSTSALNRFSTANYLPTLGITKDLAGIEIFDLISKICHLQ